MAQAKALRQRLAHDGLVLAVPLGIVPELITDLAERIDEAARSTAVDCIADLSALLVELDRLPSPSPVDAGAGSWSVSAPGKNPRLA